MYSISSFRGSIINNGTKIRWEWTYNTGGAPEAGATITLYEVVGGHSDIIFGNDSPLPDGATRPTERVDTTTPRVSIGVGSGDFPLQVLPGTATFVEEDITSQTIYSRYLVISGAQTYTSTIDTVQVPLHSAYKLSWAFGGDMSGVWGIYRDTDGLVAPTDYFPSDIVNVTITPVLEGVEHPELALTTPVKVWSAFAGNFESAFNISTPAKLSGRLTENVYSNFLYNLLTKFNIWNNTEDEFSIRDTVAARLYDKFLFTNTLLNDWSSRGSIATSINNDVSYRIDGLGQAIFENQSYPPFGMNSIAYTLKSRSFGSSFNVNNDYKYRGGIGIEIFDDKLYLAKFGMKNITMYPFVDLFGVKFTVPTYQKVIIPANLNITNNVKNKGGMLVRVSNDDRGVYKGLLQDIIYNPMRPYSTDIIDTIFNYIQKGIEIQSEINRVRILCVGDSITAGAPLYDPGYGGNIESSWPFWLGLRVGSEYEVINGGTGRQTTEAILIRDDKFKFEWMMNNYRPQYVTILLGTNDIFNSKVEDLDWTITFALSNIKKMVEICGQYDAQPIIGLNLPRTPLSDTKRDALVRYNALLTAYARENKIDIIDFYNLFDVKQDGVSTGIFNPKYTYDGDGTHPTIEGYKLMAETINIGIFESFRSDIRLYRGIKPRAVDGNGRPLPIEADLSTEEPRLDFDTYKISIDNVRRLQTRVFDRYIKNVGNSAGLFIMKRDTTVKGNGIKLSWDGKTWSDRLVGTLDPRETKKIVMRIDLPVAGNTTTVRALLIDREYRK